MTANDDLERRIADFYATESPARAPDRVLAEALTTIESTRQRRVLALVPRRYRTFYMQTKLAVAGIAVVAVMAFAVGRLLPSGGVGAGPSPSPTTALPSPTPSPTLPVAVRVPEDGSALGPGRWEATVWGSTATVKFTLGQAGWNGNSYYIENGTNALSFWSPANVYADPCDDASLPEPPTGPTVADLVAALDAQPGTVMEPFGNPVVGGHPSTRVVMHPSPGIDTTCTTGLLKLWEAGDRVTAYRAIGTTEPPDGPQEVIWIVDVDGERVVIDGVYRTSDPVESASIMEIIDSISFGDQLTR
jgi:hypothetical protein